MDRDEKIIELVENYTDEVRKYCNGRDSTIKLEYTDTFELNFKDVHYDLIRDLDKYFRKSKNDKQNITLPKLKDIFKDLIYEFENRILIQEDFFKHQISNNKNFIEEKYFRCEHINEAIVDLYDQLEIEIEKREQRVDSQGRIDPRIDSSHCIDINTRFAIALFEEILENPGKIKTLKKSKKSVLLEKLTGHKRKTFANNYSRHGAKSGEEFIDDARKLISSLFE